MRLASLPSILVFVAVLHGTAHAQDASDDALALALFNEGRMLASQNDFVHACQKFEAARGHASWLGIELNLADCYDRIGRTASAWVLFRKASADAEKIVDSRAAFARERADALEPTLSHLTIRAPTGVHVAFDGKPISSAGLGGPLPVDPGEHVVDADAPGHISWSTRITVEAKASATVVVPPLGAAPSAPPPAPVAGSPPPLRIRTRRGLVFAIAGVGIAAVGASVLLGLDAKRRYDAARPGHCDADLICDSPGFDAVHAARVRGDIATIIGGAGLASIGASVVIYLAAPMAEHPRTMVAPMVTPGSVGLTVQGPL